MWWFIAIIHDKRILFVNLAILQTTFQTIMQNIQGHGPEPQDGLHHQPGQLVVKQHDIMVDVVLVGPKETAQ